MDQEQYYSLNFKEDSKLINKDFNKLLKEQKCIFNNIMNNDKIENSNINELVKMKIHIQNIHTIIFDYIKLHGINSELIKELKLEINKYSLRYE
jgi:hypothetical protein